MSRAKSFVLGESRIILARVWVDSTEESFFWKSNNMADTVMSDGIYNIGLYGLYF